MGDSSIALLLGSGDLNDFQQNVAKDNIFTQLSPAIAGVQFDTRGWSPEEVLGTSLAKAFLSGALGRVGQNQIGEQTAKVAAILPSLYADPVGVAMPEGVDESAFNLLRGTATIKNLQRQQKQQDDMLDLRRDLMKTMFGEEIKQRMDAQYAGERKKQERLGELAAFDAMTGGSSVQTPAPAQPTTDTVAVATGLDGKPVVAMVPAASEGPVSPRSYLDMHPEDPRRKSAEAKDAGIDAVRKEFNQLIPVKEMGMVMNAADAISGALRDYGKVSDQELVRYSIQMIEPGLAVREGEQNAVARSQSIPDELKGHLQSALEGKSGLLPEVRDGIQRLAMRAYNAKKGRYEKAYNYYQDLALEKGLPADKSISFLGVVPEAEALFGAPPSQSAPPESYATEYSRLRAQGKSAQEAASILGIK